jgi:collagenase-like PrtC family protease
VSNDREVYWHLPGFYIHFYLFQVLLHLMKQYPERFEPGYRIGSVYGTFPGAIWNGGRAVFGIASRGDMKSILDTYEKLDVPVRFTWTNPLIEEKHLTDTYCNLIMELADNGKNQVLVNASVLEEYLRRTYPRFPLISSTTKRITDLEGMKAELDRGYFLVVLDYDKNHDEAVLKALEPQADRVEILVDEICFPHCPKRTEHYRDEGRMQLTFDRSGPFPCPNRLGSSVRPAFSECKKRPGFVSREQLPEYIARGYVNFKLVGRGLPQDVVREALLYYLVKDEERAFIAEKMDRELSKLPGQKR